MNIIKDGTGSFFDFAMALLAELIERTSEYTSIERTEIYEAAIAFAYIPVLQAELAAGATDLLSSNGDGTGEKYLKGKGNRNRIERLKQSLRRLADSGAFECRVFDPERTVYSNCHLKVAIARAAVKNSHAVLLGPVGDAAGRRQMVQGALSVMGRRDGEEPFEPYAREHGLMMLISAAVAAEVYGELPDITSLFSGGRRVTLLGPTELTPAEVKEKAYAYARAIITRLGVNAGAVGLTKLGLKQ